MDLDRKKKVTALRVQRHRSILANLANQNAEIENRMRNGHNHPGPIDAENKESKEEISAEMKIRMWAIKHNITRNALCDLLKILISIGLTWLPSDARTMLKTPQNIKVKNVANGQMWYSGIKNNLCRILKTIDRSIKLELNFNVDGLPLFKSSRHEFWPILANLHGKSHNCCYNDGTYSAFIIYVIVIRRFPCGSALRNIDLVRMWEAHAS